MTYATLMVHLELGQLNTSLLQVAGDLAERFHGRVIGIAGCTPSTPVFFIDGYVDAKMLAQDSQEIEKELKEAEAEFRTALQTRVRAIEWRSTAKRTSSLSDFVAREARNADLIIIGGDSGHALDAARRANTSDLVLQVGRPTFIVPPAIDKLRLERVVIGWKDTREARRAAFDALPLLKEAAHVTVVQIASEEELASARAQLEDVVGWLKWHGVVAESLASPSTGDDPGGLKAIAQEQDADVIVAGAYGHARLRELVLGGMTRNLLLRGDRCSLVSH